MSIELRLAYDNSEDIKILFDEYTQILIENDIAFADYLKMQNYDDELADLEIKYGLPNGRLYLLYYDNNLAGCIGLRKLDNDSCEMKRLYVRSDFRGKQLGDYLVKRIISDAKKIGYKSILLDTIPFLLSAIKLYKKYGFYEIESYNNSPIVSTIYMKLDL